MAVECLARSRRRHTAELLRADRHENVSLLQTPYEFVSFLRPAPVPTARNTADQEAVDFFARGAAKSKTPVVRLGWPEGNSPNWLPPRTAGGQRPEMWQEPLEMSGFLQAQMRTSRPWRWMWDRRSGC